MMDDRFDDLLRDSAREYNDPPETPREELWQRIVAAREAEKAAPKEKTEEPESAPAFSHSVVFVMSVRSPAHLGRRDCRRSGAWYRPGSHERETARSVAIRPQPHPPLLQSLGSTRSRLPGGHHRTSQSIGGLSHLVPRLRAEGRERATGLGYGSTTPGNQPPVVRLARGELMLGPGSCCRIWSWFWRRLRSCLPSPDPVISN